MRLDRVQDPAVVLDDFDEVGINLRVSGDERASGARPMLVERAHESHDVVLGRCDSGIDDGRHGAHIVPRRRELNRRRGSR